MNKRVYFTFFLLIFCSNLLFAQVPNSGGDADFSQFSPGFSFGYVNNTYTIVKKADWNKPFFDPSSNKYITDQLSSITSNNLPGFSLGFISRYSLTDNLEVRFTPTLVFADREITYVYLSTAPNVVRQIQTTTADIPFSLKLKSDRIGNFRAYIMGGLKYSLTLGKGNSSDANDLNLLDKQVKNVGGFASYEAGFGCDIYYEYFKLSPEIKLSNSFGDVLVHENQPYSSPISKLLLNTITISLYFE